MTEKNLTGIEAPFIYSFKSSLSKKAITSKVLGMLTGLTGRRQQNLAAEHLYVVYYLWLWLLFGEKEMDYGLRFNVAHYFVDKSAER